MLCSEVGDLKFFSERNLSSRIIDQPGHSSTKRTGDSCLGKSAVQHQIDSILFEDKANEVIVRQKIKTEISL